MSTPPQEPSSPPASPKAARPHWTTVQRKKQTYVVRLYWDGFTAAGARRWFVELSNGRHLGAAEGEEFARWKKKTSAGTFDQAPRNFAPHLEQN